MSDIKNLIPSISSNIDITQLENRVSNLNKSASSKSAKDVEKAATDFEALLLKQMFDEMWKTVPQNSLLSGSNEEKQFRDMYTQALAQDIAETQSIGVKQAILKDFEKAAKMGDK
jgi:flagellar protein FlgJ